MSTWAPWYRVLVIAWFLIGLPGLVIGYGFSGGEFALPTQDLGGTVAWIFAAAFVLSPAILWRWRRGFVELSRD